MFYGFDRPDLVKKSVETGGGSGGGSINVFYSNSYTNSGTISASGDTSRTPVGATGSISVGQISDGTYVDTYHNWTE